MAAMKTPGVYIVEKDAFPNSIVEVATAVPAFIGYTEFALNNNRSLKNQPWRITSMSEFEKYFGSAPNATFNLSEVPAPSVPGASVAPAPAASGSSTGKGSASKKADSSAKKTEPEAAPAAPSAASSEPVAWNDLPPLSSNPFNIGGKEYVLEQEQGKYLLYYSMALFFQNGGGPCYVVSVGNYKDPVEPDKLTAGLEPLVKEQEPTMVVIPDAMLLDGASCISLQQAMLMHCGDRMKNRIAILDIWGGYRDRQSSDGDCIAEFRNALGINFLDYSSAYYPWVNTTIVQDNTLSFNNLSDTGTLQSILKSELGLPDRANDPSLVPGPADNAAAKGRKIKLKQVFDEVSKLGPGTFPKLEDSEKSHLDKTLRQLSKNYPMILKEMAESLSLLPPAAAMAGIYTMVDDSDGVWKAPANVSVNSVVSPAVNISNEEQEDLNVTVQGKSINAIRPFIGEGVLVWGARTLDGNSLDWRYVNVRRTMIMLEESIRLASKAYVFEDNVATTWTTMESMISNFLNGIWKQGGLAGATPQAAYQVRVGLGSTMTSQDILEGILRITVLVALVRPAEFIEITFQQQMQKS